jgi:predicted O-methyltransferase YrrM
MAVTTTIKDGINAVLGLANLELSTLTRRRTWEDRLATLKMQGYFDRPVFHVPQCVRDFDLDFIARAYHKFGGDLAKLENRTANAVGFEPDNAYFSRPDAEIAYLMCRVLRPSVIVEVGSGNSTRVMRQAIIDGGLGTELIAVDPSPRVDVEPVASRFIRSRLEAADVRAVVEKLDAGDVLFIDSSHELKPGNDVLKVMFEFLPLLRPGVIVHFHDIFIPYDYPHDLLDRERNIAWSEQYALYGFILDGAYEILWPGHFAQRNVPEAKARLPFLRQGRAASFWMRKRATQHP